MCWWNCVEKYCANLLGFYQFSGVSGSWRLTEKLWHAYRIWHSKCWSMIWNYREILVTKNFDLRRSEFQTVANGSVVTRNIYLKKKNNKRNTSTRNDFALIAAPKSNKTNIIGIRTVCMATIEIKRRIGKRH